MSSTDRDALLALFHSAGGAGWERKDNWDTDLELSKWHGVEVNARGRVVKLSLPSNNLRGDIPKELGSLFELRELLLHKNRLTGRIPKEIGALSRLQNLSLGGNRLVGTIPRELGRLAALTRLWLNNNCLEGEIPAQLGDLGKLEQLWLGDNELTGRIPPELGKLGALKELSLSKNGLTGEIPKELGSLAKLERLRIAENGLVGDIPKELGALGKMVNLNLSKNHLNDAPDPSLSEKDLKRWRRTLRGEARVSAAATNVPPVAPVRPWASRPPPAAPRQASASRPPPAAARASASPPPPFSARQAPISPPPPYRRTAGPAPVPTTHVLKPSSGPCCTPPRVAFWTSCALSVLVWALSVGAAVDDDWVDDWGISAGRERLLDRCVPQALCHLYKGFTATQYIAVVLASISVIVYSATLFRPAAAPGRRFGLRTVAVFGASIMAGSAFSQMLSFVLIIVITNDLDRGSFDYYHGSDATLGRTFIVSVTACVLGVMVSGMSLAFAPSAGNGPLFRCCRECLAFEHYAESAVGGVGGGGGDIARSWQQHPGKPAAAVATGAAAVLPPPAAVAPPQPGSAAV